MCGFVGVAGDFDSTGFFTTSALQNRGPDGVEVILESELFLHFRRLAITGIENGSQPTFSQCGRYVSVTNGEIYNYRELAASYNLPLSPGESDSHVVSNLFAKLGKRMFTKLQGMFAIAILDLENRTLVLARDALGKKPLYWSKCGEESIAFASRIDAFPPHRGAPSTEWLLDYITFGHAEFSNVSANPSVYRVTPGQILIFKNGQIVEEENIQWDMGQNETQPVCEHSLFELLKKSISKRIPQETAFALQLSGGVDSTLVAFGLRELGLENFPVFHFTQSNESDELDRAKKTSEVLGLELEVVRTPDLGTLTDLWGILSKFDEPFWDGAIPSVHAFEVISKSGFRVALTGDGPDELLGGYDRQRLAAKLSIPSKYVGFVAAPLARLAPEFGLKSDAPRWAAAVRRSVEIGERAPQDWLLRFVQPNSLPKILNEELLQVAFRPHPLREYSPVPMSAFWQFELTMHLSGILKKVDTSSMENSVEARSPFLDEEFVQLSSRFSNSERFGPGKSGGKSMLRNILRVNGLEHVAKGPKKGFGAPRSLFGVGLLRDAGNLLLRPQLRNLFQQEFLEDVSHRFLAMVPTLLDWRVLTLALHQEFET